MRTCIIMVAVLMAGVVSAADDRSALSELDAKIAKGMSSDTWNEASKAFVGALWRDYRNAHLTVGQDKTTRDVFGKMPDVQNPDDYQGCYTRGKNANRPFLSVSRAEGGRLFVDLEGHHIPAVYRNKSIIFTTGDLVYSQIPMFGAKPYCTLEMFMVLRTEGKFYCASPGTRPEKWVELSRSDGKK
jgi:hypothetical protein